MTVKDVGILVTSGTISFPNSVANGNPKPIGPDFEWVEILYFLYLFHTL